MLGTDLGGAEHRGVDRPLAQLRVTEGLAPQLGNGIAMLAVDQLGDRLAGNAHGLVEIDAGSPGDADIHSGDAAVEPHLGIVGRRAPTGWVPTGRGCIGRLSTGRGSGSRQWIKE